MKTEAEYQAQANRLRTSLSIYPKQDILAAIVLENVDDLVRAKDPGTILINALKRKQNETKRAGKQ